MKIAITGDTKGIGLATATLLRSQGHDVVGFSRHNGWDLTDKTTREEFISTLDSGDYDCFINNAYPHKFYKSMEGYFQVELLNQAWLLWEKKENKMIVCIGAATSDSTKNYFHPYSIHKKALDDTCNQLRNIRECPHIINIKPTYVDTQVISHLTNVKKSTPNEVAELILWAMTRKVKITDLTFSSFNSK
jgi:NADP-dependent 3-hydroxy acid dehydrogenase YdfG